MTNKTLIFLISCTFNLLSATNVVPTVSAFSPSVPVQVSSLHHHHFQPRNSKFTLIQQQATPSSSSDDNDNDDKISKANTLKAKLLSALQELRDLQDRDGDFSDIDWGAKGGELTETGRVPRQVDYGMISQDVGKAAQQVMQLCDQLAQISPTEIPTQFLGDKLMGDQAPLNGPWKLLFTNAADAIFSKDSKRGEAKAQNVVNAKRGRITNVIDFATLPDGTEPTLKQLNVIIKATAVSNVRVQLDFRYAKVVLTRFLFGIPIPFGKMLPLYIPVPATFVTACIELVKRIQRFFSRSKPNQEEKRTPKGYFDVLFLDDQLRVHRTGQGNLFVQAKEDNWEQAKPLLIR